jgi:RNA polymerase-binding transcription factor DksA
MNAAVKEELYGTRERLMARAAELRERVTRIHQDLRRETAPLPRDAPDAAIVIENDEILEAIEEAANSELRQIAHALGRLDAGVFGYCESCDAPIEKERMRLVPQATHCRRCAEGV